MEEKRRSKRLDLEGEIILSRLDAGADGNGKKANVVIKNVSKTGIGFSCDQSLAIGTVYECNLTIWTKETLHCFVEIVRAYSEEGKFMYGGIFVGMSEMDMKRIEIYSTLQDAGL